MKNREYRVLLALALMASLVAGSVGGTTMYAHAESGKTAVVSEAKSVSEARAKKDETVYIKMDASGNAKAVTVSDQLRNITDMSEIEDVSDLQNIENVKGDETYEEKDGKLVWTGDKKEICYQGTTSKKIPVGVKISYQLDGKDITAEELEGKSGHLVIRYEYQNTTEDDGDYTPFLMVTGLVLDTEKFANVTINNGKIISDGERDIAIGMGLPQMKENLGTEDLDIPDSFTLEADVTEYEEVEGITVATNQIFNDMETDQFDSLGELKGSMAELQSASRKLVSGSGELKEGLDTLLASSDTLINGVGELEAGGTKLDAGAGNLKNGADTLRAGMAEASAKVSGALLGGVQQVDAGVGRMQTSLQSESVQRLANGVKSLNTGLNTGNSQSGQPSLKAAAHTVSEGTAQVGGALAQLSAGAQAAGQASSSAGEHANQLAEQIAALSGTTTMSDVSAQGVTVSEVSGTGTAEGTINLTAYNAGAISTLEGLLANMNSSDPAYTDIQNAINQMKSDVQVTVNNASVSGVAGTGDVSGIRGRMTNPDMTQLLQLARITAAETTGVNGAINGDGTMQNPGLAASLAAVSTSVNGTENTVGLKVGAQAVADGVENAATGAAQLDEGINGRTGLLAQVSGGTAQLKAGTKQLVEGVGGTDGLAAGMKLLTGGSAQLASGAGELKAGTGTLSAGLGTLQNGSKALIAGVKQLDVGAEQLHNGMIQFDEEGIEKLVSAFDGDIEGLLGRVNTMLDASRAYKSFSGISDNMDGEVKFVFVSGK